jgi:hypothetical protein
MRPARGRITCGTQREKAQREKAQREKAQREKAQRERDDAPERAA